MNKKRKYLKYFVILNVIVLILGINVSATGSGGGAGHSSSNITTCVYSDGKDEVTYTIDPETAELEVLLSNNGTKFENKITNKHFFNREEKKISCLDNIYIENKDKLFYDKIYIYSEKNENTTAYKLSSSKNNGQEISKDVLNKKTLACTYKFIEYGNPKYLKIQIQKNIFDNTLDEYVYDYNGNIQKNIQLKGLNEDDFKDGCPKLGIDCDEKNKTCKFSEKGTNTELQTYWLEYEDVLKSDEKLMEQGLGNSLYGNSCAYQINKKDKLIIQHYSTGSDVLLKYDRNKYNFDLNPKRNNWFKDQCPNLKIKCGAENSSGKKDCGFEDFNLSPKKVCTYKGIYHDPGGLHLIGKEVEVIVEYDGIEIVAKAKDSKGEESKITHNLNFNDMKEMGCPAIYLICHENSCTFTRQNIIYNQSYTLGIEEFKFDRVSNETTEDLTGCAALGDLKGDFQLVWNIIKIAAPILVLILGSFDYIQALVSSDSDMIKKTTTKFTKRLLLAIILFFIPYLVDLLFQISGIDNSVEDFVCGIR